MDHHGLAIIEPPANVDELHMTLEVTRQDGRIVRTPVVIQGATGEIELDTRQAAASMPTAEASPHRAAPHHRDHEGRHRAAPLDRTLSRSETRRRLEAEALHRSFR